MRKLYLILYIFQLYISEAWCSMLLEAYQNYIFRSVFRSRHLKTFDKMMILISLKLYLHEDCDMLSACIRYIQSFLAKNVIVMIYAFYSKGQIYIRHAFFISNVLLDLRVIFINKLNILISISIFCKNSCVSTR